MSAKVQRRRSRLGGALGYDESQCLSLTNDTQLDLWYGFYFTRTEGGGSMRSTKVSVAESKLRKIPAKSNIVVSRPKYRGVLARGDREMVVISIAYGPGGQDTGAFTKAMWKSVSGPENIFTIENDSIKAVPRAKIDTDNLPACKALLAKTGGQNAFPRMMHPSQSQTAPQMIHHSQIPQMIHPHMMRPTRGGWGGGGAPGKVGWMAKAGGAEGCAFALNMATEAMKAGLYSYVGLYNTKSGNNSTTVSQLLRDKSASAEGKGYEGTVYIDRGESTGFFSRQNREFYVYFQGGTVANGEMDIPKILRKTVSAEDNHFFIHDDFAIAYNAPIRCP